MKKQVIQPKNEQPATPESDAIPGETFVASTVFSRLASITSALDRTLARVVSGSPSEHDSATISGLAALEQRLAFRVSQYPAHYLDGDR